MNSPLSPILEVPTITPVTGSTSSAVISSEQPKPKEEPKEEPKPKEEPESKSTPLSARAEDFAEQPADVLLTYPEAVSPNYASRCIGLSAAGDSEGFGGVEQGPSTDTLRLELVPGGAMPAKVQCPASHEALSVSPAGPSPGGVVSDPIDAKYLTEAPFGTRSFWIQPWRAYLDTWPASRLLDSLGINFNVNEKEAEDTARLLQDSGFKLARIEIGWDSLSYENPTKFVNEASIRKRLEALHNHGLRPLILLNANSGGPGPAQVITLETVGEAPVGSRTVTLTPASAAVVVPGKTGFAGFSFGGNPAILITSVAGDVATLSKPLPQAMPAGEHKGSTLLYAPFGPPQLSDGEPNPVFQATLAGWLSYVATICKEAQSIFGPEGYDLEVWNEL
ncbi:MAG TPA: hypothetical protein VKA15_01205, partial [Isosphaeraceae bacterium]|nr:hypothetical protein [Isosphaeraceae bacterium]